MTSGGGGAVSSVFGRAGAVVAVSGDYSPTQTGFSSYPLTPGVDYPTPTAGGRSVVNYYIHDAAGTMTITDAANAAVGTSYTDVAAALQAIDGVQALDTIVRVFLDGFCPGGSGAQPFKPSARKGMILCGFAGQDQEAPISGINWSSTTVSLWDDVNWADFKHAEHLGLENIVIWATNFTGTLLNDSSGSINSYVFQDCSIENTNGAGGFVHTGVMFNPGFKTESNATSVLSRCNFFGFHDIIISTGGLIGGEHLQLGFFDHRGFDFSGSFSNAAVFTDIKLYGIIGTGVGIYDNRTAATQSLLIVNGLEQENSAQVNYQNVNGARYYIAVSSPYIGIPTLPAVLTNIGKARTIQKSETGADANVLTYTPPSDGGGGGISPGPYRIKITVSVSAATAATLGWTLTYTDANGNAQTPTNLALHTLGVAASALTVVAAAGAAYYDEAVVDSDGIANIVVKTTFTGTSIAYKVSVTIEAV